jgi:hypothetical protein
MHDRDNLRRAALILIDLKRVTSIDEAYAVLDRYRLRVAIGPDAARTEAGQACLLTIVNVGARACVGGVHVTGLDGTEPLLTELGAGTTLARSVRRLGGIADVEVLGNTPVILIGDVSSQPEGEPKVRATYGGWTGAIVPDGDVFRLAEDSGFPPAAVLAGTLAVSECFSSLLGADVAAGYRPMGLSLYEPGRDWRSAIEPAGVYLPDALWLLGLGHLGQAYAWTLAALPYPLDQRPIVYLQDYDIATAANASTSVLTHSHHVARMKTRVVSRWLESRRFTTYLIERRFSEDFRLGRDEPRILVCGVDNLPTRRLLERPGFGFVLDAGLGATAADYDGFFVQAFTDTGRAATAFPEPTRVQTRQDRISNNRAAYDSLGLDECGMHWAADVVVGVPFVGVAVSCLVLAAVVRAIGGDSLWDTVSGNLRSIDLVDAYSAGTIVRNPGYIPARVT